MRKIKNTICQTVFSLALLMAGNKVVAQSHTYVVRDFESWTSLEAKLKFSKKFNLGIEESMRLQHNSTRFDQLFTNLDMSYSLNKSLVFKTGLRYVNQEEGEDKSNTNHLRYFLSGTVKYKVSDVSFSHRLMYTNKNEIGLSNKEGDVHINNLRLHTQIGYNIHHWKLDPIASVEFFRKYKGDNSSWDKFRVKLGTEFEIKKHGEVGVFYGIEKEFSSNMPKSTHILGLSYTHTFKLY